MNIIELAKQAGINSPDGFKLTINHMATFQLEKFAELVAAAARADEREACAKACEDYGKSCDNSWNKYLGVADDLRETAEEFAAAIRARGTT